jgi:hypothetical protein
MKYEVLSVIRVTANIVGDVVGTYLVPVDREDPRRATAVKQAETLFKNLHSNYGPDDEDVEDALENGFFEESDGDTISLTWSHVTNHDEILKP